MTRPLYTPPDVRLDVGFDPLTTEILDDWKQTRGLDPADAVVQAYAWLYAGDLYPELEAFAAEWDTAADAARQQAGGAA